MFASLSLLDSTGFLSQHFVCSSQLCHLLGTWYCFVKFAANNFVAVGYWNLFQDLFVIIISSECSFTQHQFCS